MWAERPRESVGEQFEGAVGLRDRDRVPLCRAAPGSHLAPVGLAQVAAHRGDRARGQSRVQIIRRAEGSGERDLAAAEEVGQPRGERRSVQHQPVAGHHFGCVTQAGGWFVVVQAGAERVVERVQWCLPPDPIPHHAGRVVDVVGESVYYEVLFGREVLEEGAFGHLRGRRDIHHRDRVEPVGQEQPESGIGDGRAGSTLLALAEARLWVHTGHSSRRVNLVNKYTWYTFVDMRIGVALPTDYYEQLTPGVNPVEYLLDQARKLAELGVPAVWLTQRFDYDALAVAALIGRELPGTTVGTAIVPIHPRHPNALAMQAHTAQAAGGRFELGLGLSLPAIAAGYGNTHPRIRYLREYLTALRELLYTGAVDHTGETLVARSPARSTMPALHSPVPILLAASGPLTLRVAAELADGALPLLTGPNTLADFTIPTLAGRAADAGRPMPRVLGMVGGVVTADVAGARERAARQMHRYGEMPAYRALLDRENITDPAELAVIGDEQTMADAVARYAEAGADELVFALTALGSERDEERTWALLGELSRTGSH